LTAVRLFVSYSRADATFVARLVAVLEGDGHDVWVDTEDIRGSEEWRASIVRGIRQADAVVLVISPRSMASDEVAREIAVAAHEERRIVPVMLEEAALPDSIGYELLGVQHVSFADRPFGESVAHLRAALAPTIATTAAEGAPSGHRQADDDTPRLPEPASRRNHWRAIVTAVGLIAAVAAGSAIVRSLGGDEPPSSGSDTPVQAADAAGSLPAQSRDAAGSLAAPAAEATVDLAADVWFAGFEILVHDATVDDDRVSVDLTLTNVQPTSSDPLLLLLEDVAVEWDGRRATGNCPGCTSMPPEASLNLTWGFYVDEAFALEKGVLVLGQPRDHQTLVPFDGSPPTAQRPTTLDVTGVADDGAGTTFTVERIEVVPVRCAGYSNSMTYGPAPADEMSVIVWGTAETTRSETVYFGSARLVLPDGKVLGSSSLLPTLYWLKTGQPERDIPVCFTIRLPATGEHRFLAGPADMFGRDLEPAGPGIPFTLDL
jgi:hypothetical protein